MLRKLTSGLNQVWLMNGATRIGTVDVTPDPPSLDWQVVGIDDFTGDKRNDLLLWNSTTGAVVYWLMDANVVRFAGNFTNPPNAGNNNWKVLAGGDYGVGPGGLPTTKDIVWRNADSGRFVVWYMD